jgi:hypothetical protein
MLETKASGSLRGAFGRATHHGKLISCTDPRLHSFDCLTPLCPAGLIDVDDDRLLNPATGDFVAITKTFDRLALISVLPNARSSRCMLEFILMEAAAHHQTRK